MALPNYTQTGQTRGPSRNQISSQHPNWNDDRVQRNWQQNQRPVVQTAPASGGTQQAVYNPTQTGTPTAPANYTLTQNPGYQGPVNAPQQSAAHPFFDPNSNYAQTGRTYGVLPGQGTPGNNAFNLYGTDNPEGYYYSILNQRGLGGFDARSQVAQGMFRDVARGYEAAKMNNMELWFPEYLEQWDPNEVLNLLSEEQLGIDRSRFAGRDRWGMRGGQ